MIINLQWSGPHSYNDVLEMDGASDHGLYQIYNTHPVYGNDTLIYIGQANVTTFSERFGQPDRIWMNDDLAPWEDNGERIRIHTGRIHPNRDEAPPDNDTWGNWITLAENLLIFAHSPAWNSRSVRDLPNGEDYRDVHVLNWGQHGLLLPEVSGARHTRAVFNRLGDDPLEWNG